MNIFEGALYAISSFLISVALTFSVYRFAHIRQLLVQPSLRSSHVEPRPNIGGLGFVVATTLVLLWLYADLGGLNWKLAALVLMSVALAGLGLWDDLRPLRIRLRLSVQTMICLLLLALIGEDILDPEYQLPGYVAVVLLFFAALWWVNLFNFMDGIDGIAASQGIYMLLAGAGLAAWISPDAVQMVWWIGSVVTAAAVGGFLVFNWAPAKVFMGDGGSTYLGFMIFFFAQAFVQSEWMGWATWLILATLFLSDSTLTLVYRARRGECLCDAHREHAYQILSRQFGSHQFVTLLFLLLNLVYLLPLAAASIVWPDWSLAWLAFAYMPVIAGVCLVKSYLDDEQEGAELVAPHGGD